MLTVELADPLRYRSLTIVPLVTPSEAELPYALLADALAADALTITEVADGVVRELLAANDSDSDVLVLDGEQLIGALQNRMTNRTLLLPARSKTNIPVSCMEQGRWSRASDKFAPSPQHSPAKVRRKPREREARYADAGLAAPRESLGMAQGDVWSTIADHSARIGAVSATGALDHVQAARAGDVGSWIEMFPVVPGQVGVLAFVGGRPIGLDVIGGRALYARLHDRLMRGYIMDALELPDAPGSPGREAAQHFLDLTREAGRVEAPTVGRGRYGVLSTTVVGGELMDGERVAHLSAFPRDDSGRASADTGGAPITHPIAPPSRRRRQR